MAEKKFTNELKQTFDYIQNTLLKEYNCDKISTEYFVLSVLENDDSVGNRVLSKIMLHDSMENAKIHFYEWLSQNSRSFGNTKEYDELFDKSIKNAKTLASQQKSKTINSGHVLATIFANNLNIGKYFKTLGVTSHQINTQVLEETNTIIEEEKRNNNFIKGTPVKHVHKPKDNNVKENTQNIIEDENIVVSTIAQQVNRGNIGECEKIFINLNQKAYNSHIDKIYGNNKIYEKIYSILSKRNKNNVIIVGKSGVGKTDTVRNLANLIVNGNVPKPFKDKILLEVDFNTLFSGTSMRGTFESRMKTIINDAKQKANYIFFIDSLNNVLKSKFNETDLEDFIETIMKEKSIMLICTSSESGYTKEIADYPEWERYFEKISMEEPSEEECINILRQHVAKLECFHNVKYDESVYDTCVKLCKRYITERRLPDSAIDILDKAGAEESLKEVENDNIRIAREKLNNIKFEKEKLKHSTSKRDYNKIDKLEKEEIELQTILDFAIKAYNLEKQPFVITNQHIRKCISEKTNIPLEDMTMDDMEKLKGLNDRIKQIVIGQNEAVDEICKAIKRQRLGINNPNKPIVFLMAGSTGVGKTHLAKTIAKEIFGNEKQLVRFDMAEYADKTSVGKLVGTGAGFIGYDKGGLLTEAIKKNKHCVLLLDEIEKADEDVHNIFLSLFDEGKVTDNKGISVDFKNTIIIMTSNIGAKEVDERGNGIGFVKNENVIKKEIIQKELKRKFKPEFINRIDKIVYFNKLTDENLKDIISIEIMKVLNRVIEIGYDFNDFIINGQLNEELINLIYNKVKGQKKLGARPILREIQKQIEDKISDFILNNNIPKGYKISIKDIRG